jgi:hypothetical protein
LTDKYISREIEIGFYTNNASDLCKAINAVCEKIFNEIDNDAYIGTHSGRNSLGMYGSGARNSSQNSAQNFGFKIKSTGISIYQLKPHGAVQDDLFAIQSTLDSKSQYTEVIDSLKSRLGADSVYLCSSLESKKRRDQIFEQRNLKNKFIYGLPLPYMGEVS